MNSLDRYLVFGLRNVNGWLDGYSAEFIGALSNIQRRSGITGAVGEIGVHHGKLFIVLMLTTTNSERAFAIDVFEHQHLNIDGSGYGDRAMFLANLKHWGAADTNLSVIQQSSLEVQPSDILAACGPVRLASIDGGHTEECTLNDLVLMEAVLSDQGVVVIDDCFNPGWPGVSAGVARYLSNPVTKLRPFAISPNKVYLTAPNNAIFYQGEIRKQFGADKQSVMFGSDVDIYGTAQPRLTLSWFLRERLKESAIGPLLLAAKRRIGGSIEPWRTRR